jgi:RNA polymerase sigma factor (sigma-70 family)
MCQQWVTNAERPVKFAARAQGDALNLPRDEHRDADAYSHARERADRHRAANPTFFSSEVHCRNWMIHVARNWVSDYARRQRAREGRERKYERPESSPDRTPLCDHLREAVAALPADERAVVELYRTGKTWAEIAAALGVPLATAYGRFKRALPRLRRELDRRGVGAEDLCRPIEPFEEADDPNTPD